MTIVLSVHGLGAAWLGCYGNEWTATPNLDRLAAEGVVYDHHFATDKSFTPLAGYTHLRDPREDRPLANLRKLLANQEGDIHIESDAFVEPWFAPAEIVEDYDGEFARYAAAVAYFDAEFGALREAKPEVRWVVAGISGHALSREEPVHLPLIVGDASRAGLRVDALTADTDLAAILRAETVERETVVSRVAGQWSLRTREWTLCGAPDAWRLHHRPEDRFEVNDVSRLHSDTVEELLQAHAKQTGDIS